MSVFNRVMLRSTAFLKTVPKVGLMQRPALATFHAFNSTLLDKKEQAEETKYIRELEKKKQEDVRKKLETILALEDSSQQKQDLQALLDRKDEEKPKGFIEKYGLSDWYYAVPFGLLIATPAVYNEVIIIDGHFQLTACFLIFAAALYSNVGPIISKSLEEYRQEVEKDINATNATAYNQINSIINANNAVLNLEEDLKTLHTVSDQIQVAHAELLNQQEEHKYREAIIKKLESLQALEDSAASAIRARIVNTVKEDVFKTFKNDKKVQENALNHAINVLNAGTNAKIGKDIVGDVFVNSIKSYKDNYAKQPEGSDEILKQLEKDVAAVAAAPEISSKGGNVFQLYEK